MEKENIFPIKNHKDFINLLLSKDVKLGVDVTIPLWGIYLSLLF